MNEDDIDRIRQSMLTTREIEEIIRDLESCDISFHGDSRQEFYSLVSQARHPVSEALLRARTLPTGFHHLPVGADMKILVNVPESGKVLILKIGSHLGDKSQHDPQQENA